MYVECTEDWKIRGGRFFEFAKLEGNLKGGERSALEAMNNGVKLSPTEYEAIRILDSDDDNTKNPFKSILAIIVKQANELAYAIERERYNKAKNMENK